MTIRFFWGYSLLDLSDDWGQYCFEIQCGTYPITGCCENCGDASWVAKVLPGTSIYANLFLRRDMVIK
jgi:hypothetical protein